MANLSPILLNNVYSTVQAGSSAIGSSSATGINVATGDGATFGTIGTNQYIPAVIVDTSTSPETVKEYVWITSRSTDALTVTRQAEESARYPASTTTVAAGYTIAAVASVNGLYAIPGGVGFSARDYGWLIWNYNRDPNTTFNGIASGRIFAARIPIPETMSVTNIVMEVRTAGSGLTANQCLAGIYDSTGAQIGKTADQSTAWGSTGLKTMALASGPFTVTGGPGVYAYILIVANGTAGPAFTQLNVSQDLNVNMSPLRFGVQTQSGATALPSSFTPGSLSATNLLSHWVALS